MAVVAAVVLVGILVQRMATPPSARVVRSVQLTFTGQVNWPSIEGEFFPALATDGGRVYFTQMTGNRYTLAQSSIGGGEVVTIRTPFNHALLLNVSPDGSRLLVREFDWAQLEGTLWVIPAVGGAPLRLGAVVAHDASWSPDGKRIVFARGEELYVAGSDGSSTAKARDDARPRVLGALVPGRRALAIHGRESARIPAALGSLGRGSRPAADASGPSRTRRGLLRRVESGRAAFLLQAVPGRQGRHLGHPGADGPLLRENYRARARDERTAALSCRRPDPGRPAVAGHRRPTAGREPAVRSGHARIRAVRRGKVGTVVRVLARRTVDGLRQVPRGNILWRSRVDGSARLQLTQPPLQLLLPRWSPDGTRIAFMGRTPGRPWKIYAIAAEGGEAQPILEGDRPESDPDWAPDGQSLMFGRPPDYLAESSVPKAIHLLDLRTRELSTLPGSEGLFGSRWSPSGRYVAALSLDHARLLLFDFSTQAWTELGRFKNLHNPVWSRDERFLYFEVVDEASIYRARLSDRAVERVVGLEGVWRTGTGAARSRAWRRTTHLSFRVSAPTPTSTLWIGRCGDS